LLLRITAQDIDLDVTHAAMWELAARQLSQRLTNRLGVVQLQFTRQPHEQAVGRVVKDRVASHSAPVARLTSSLRIAADLAAHTSQRYA